MVIVIHGLKKEQKFAKFGRKEFFIKPFSCICILLHLRVSLGVFNFEADFSMSSFSKH